MKLTISMRFLSNGGGGGGGSRTQKMAKALGLSMKPVLEVKGLGSLKPSSSVGTLDMSVVHCHDSAIGLVGSCDGIILSREDLAGEEIEEDEADYCFEEATDKEEDAMAGDVTVFSKRGSCIHAGGRRGISFIGSVGGLSSIICLAALLMLLFPSAAAVIDVEHKFTPKFLPRMVTDHPLPTHHLTKLNSLQMMEKQRFLQQPAQEQAIDQVIRGLASSFADGVSFFLDSTRTACQGITVISDFVDEIIDFINDILDAIKNGLNTIVALAKSFCADRARARKLFNAAAAPLNKYVNSTSPTKLDKRDNFRYDPTALDALLKPPSTSSQHSNNMTMMQRELVLGSLWNTVTSTATNTISDGLDPVAAVKEGVNDILKSADDILVGVNGIGNFIEGNILDVLGELTASVGTITEKVSSIVGEVSGKITDAVDDISDTIGGVAELVLGQLTNFAKDIIGEACESIDKVESIVKKIEFGLSKTQGFLTEVGVRKTEFIDGMCDEEQSGSLVARVAAFNVSTSSISDELDDRKLYLGQDFCGNATLVFDYVKFFRPFLGYFDGILEYVGLYSAPECAGTTAADAAVIGTTGIPPVETCAVVATTIKSVFGAIRAVFTGGISPTIDIFLTSESLILQPLCSCKVPKGSFLKYSGCDKKDNNCDRFIDECDEDHTKPSIVLDHNIIPPVPFKSSEHAEAFLWKNLKITDDCARTLNTSISVNHTDGIDTYFTIETVDPRCKDETENATQTKTIALQVDSEAPLVSCGLFVPQNPDRENQALRYPAHGEVLVVDSKNFFSSMVDVGFWHTIEDNSEELLQVSVQISTNERVDDFSQTAQLYLKQATNTSSTHKEAPRAGIILDAHTCGDSFNVNSSASNNPNNNELCNAEANVQARFYDIDISAIDAAGNVGKATCSVAIVPIMSEASTEALDFATIYKESSKQFLAASINFIYDLKNPSASNALVLPDTPSFHRCEEDDTKPSIELDLDLIPSVPFKSTQDAKAFLWKHLKITDDRATTLDTSISVNLFDGILTHFSIVAVDPHCQDESDDATQTKIIPLSVDSEAPTVSCGFFVPQNPIATRSKSSKSKKYPDLNYPQVNELLIVNAKNFLSSMVDVGFWHVIEDNSGEVVHVVMDILTNELVSGSSDIAMTYRKQTTKANGNYQKAPRAGVVLDMQTCNDIAGNKGICLGEAGIQTRFYDIAISATDVSGNVGSATCSLAVFPITHTALKSNEALFQVYEDSTKHYLAASTEFSYDLKNPSASDVPVGPNPPTFPKLSSFIRG